MSPQASAQGGIPQDLALRLQLATFAGNEPPSSFIEIRPLDPPGRQWFVPVRELDSAVAIVQRLAGRHQVFAGVNPRVRRAGTTDAVERTWCLVVDCDSPDSAERLRAFRPLPSLVVRSGSGANLHAYWQLRRPIAPAHAVRANRRLALALGSDRAVCDAARVMRVIGTWNRKREPAVRAECVRLELDSFTVDQVVGGLPDDPAYAPQPAGPRRMGKDGTGALAGLVRVVLESSEGERNQRLNWSAFRAGEHVAAGALDATEAEAKLLAAALSIGLPEGEALRTIASGLGAGERVAA